MSNQAHLRVPPFPLLGEPGEWDELTLLASTIFLESDGEPDDGKLAVGYVCIARRAWGLTLHQVILGPDSRAYGEGKPYEAFSAWNDDYRPIAQARLAAAADTRAEPCWRAAAAALWNLVPNPVPGAYFYLNVPLTLKIRKDHRLPTWAADPRDPTRVDPVLLVAEIGRHTFLRARA